VCRSPWTTSLIGLAIQLLGTNQISGPLPPRASCYKIVRHLGKRSLLCHTSLTQMVVRTDAARQLADASRIVATARDSCRTTVDSPPLSTSSS
jgi:hypothetical protein